MIISIILAVLFFWGIIILVQLIPDEILVDLNGEKNKIVSIREIVNNNGFSRN